MFASTLFHGSRIPCCTSSSKLRGLAKREWVGSVANKNRSTAGINQSRSTEVSAAPPAEDLGLTEHFSVSLSR